VNEKLDKLLSEISDLRQEFKVHAAKTDLRLDHYNTSLDKHMKRTEILEKEGHDLWRWKWFIAGGLGVVTVAAQIIIKLMVK
jgi:hypothetical protein